MTTKYIFSDALTLTQWDTQWQIPAKEAWLAEYQNEFPQEKCETRQAYQDRITGITQNTIVKLATDGVTLHTDRMVNPILQANPLKILCGFDDVAASNPQNPDYYCTQAWRDLNGGETFTIIDQTEAEQQGFIFSDD